MKEDFSAMGARSEGTNRRLLVILMGGMLLSLRSSQQSFAPPPPSSPHAFGGVEVNDALQPKADGDRHEKGELVKMLKPHVGL